MQKIKDLRHVYQGGKNAGVLTRKATFPACSSYEAGGECGNVVNGITKRVKDNSNCWISMDLSEKGEWLSL